MATPSIVGIGLLGKKKPRLDPMFLEDYLSTESMTIFLLFFYLWGSPNPSKTILLYNVAFLQHYSTIVLRELWVAPVDS